MATRSKSTDSEVAVLQNQVENLQVDATEIKSDIKEIKAALESNFVTHIEFDNYKSTQFTQKVLLSIINLVFGALLGFFISQIINNSIR